MNPVQPDESRNRWRGIKKQSQWSCVSKGAQSPILQTIHNRHDLGAIDKMRVLGGRPTASHVYEVRGAAKRVGNKFFSVLVHSMETILKGTQEACIGRGTSHYLVGYLLDSQVIFPYLL